jgi:peptidoglycan/xylan/chitin deacetylase (PgdA/CDA1 family)
MEANELDIVHESSSHSSENLKVLIYHRILEDEEQCKKESDLCVHVDEFRKQLSLLERWGYTTITFHDYRLCLEGALNLPRKPIIITFDDGYEDIHRNALPLLQEFGMKAVVFAIGDNQIKTNTWDIDNGSPARPLMSPQQILEVHAAGFEIGSHSLTHADLSSVSKETSWEEISRSRMLLEILLNARVESFAYPYGLTNEHVKRMVADAGYTTGCGVYSGPAKFGEDLFDIRRILITNGMGTFRFALRILSPYEYYAWFKWKLKQLLLLSRNSTSPSSSHVHQLPHQQQFQRK